MKIEHKLSPAWAKHLAEVRAQIEHTNRENWILKGQIAHNEQQIVMMQKHIATSAGVIADAEGAPPSKTPYALSPDGTSLIGDDGKEVNNGVAG